MEGEEIKKKKKLTNGHRHQGGGGLPRVGMAVVEVREKGGICKSLDIKLKKKLEPFKEAEL